LDRVSDSESEGRGFESRRTDQTGTRVIIHYVFWLWFLFYNIYFYVQNRYDL